MSAIRPLDDEDLSVEAPRHIAKAVMIHRWARLALVHWPFEPAVVQKLLPPHLEVDCFDGAAWIGAIPFHLSVKLPPFMPAPPILARTLEVNLRTYVRGPDGRRGIWFFSLDAQRLAPALVARVWYRIPYFWAKMRFTQVGRTLQYESRRKLHIGTPAHFSCRLDVDPDSSFDLSPLEQFVTCRWRLYAPGAGGITVSQIEHRPWPINRCRPVSIRCGLLDNFGIPLPPEPPSILFSRCEVSARLPHGVVGTSAPLLDPYSVPLPHQFRDLSCSKSTNDPHQLIFTWPQPSQGGSIHDHGPHRG